MISVIIPTYNEESHIENTIKMLWQNDEDNLVKEIIIVDAGSSDDTIAIAQKQKVKTVISPKKGRAAQMNHGVSFAGEKLLFFLHADTIPPAGFTRHIAKANDQGFVAGCFILSFDHDHWFLKANAWFTRFDIDAFRFGDQGLFITRDAFLETGGFCEKHIVLEDQHFVKKIKRRNRFFIIKKTVTTSARKYLENGIYKTQFIFLLVYLMARLGFPQKKLVSTYKKLITRNKL